MQLHVTDIAVECTISTECAIAKHGPCVGIEEQTTCTMYTHAISFSAHVLPPCTFVSTKGKHGCDCAEVHAVDSRYSELIIKLVETSVWSLSEPSIVQVSYGRHLAK